MPSTVVFIENLRSSFFKWIITLVPLETPSAFEISYEPELNLKE